MGRGGWEEVQGREGGREEEEKMGEGGFEIVFLDYYFEGLL